jgi:hypothetical protein
MRALVSLFLLCLFASASWSASEIPATNALRPWLEYRTIMWIGDSARKAPDKLPLFFERLREMGVNTGMVYGDADPQPLLDNRFPYYVENMVNRGLCLKWSSQVRDWDKFVTDWTRNGRDESAFVRDYCLDDPQWRAWARKEVQTIVRRNAPHAPIAYDLRDELSVTISANPFDYDFHPIALAQFRDWLKEQYRPGARRPIGPAPASGSPKSSRTASERGGDGERAALAALNAQWQTQFATWDDVKPFTTDQVKNRMASGDALPRGKPDWQAVQRVKFDPATARQEFTRWNCSPWCDFRTYMDISLAGALDELRRAARELDPHTPVGIEGTQMPHAFGGYDLWRLARALDWVEPYDIGNARAILGSFMPGQPMLCTVFEKDTRPATRRLWHLLLEGDRGCILWWSEDCIDWKSGDLKLTAKARALAPVLKELTSPLARLFLRAERERDPVAIHYSQPSVQVDWLLESTADGSTWHRRFSSFEADHNRMARVRDSWLKAFQDLGFSPVFVSSEEVANGALSERNYRVFVMPQSLALSSAEAEMIRAFLFSPTDAAAAGRVAFADGTPGQFDESGRLRPRSRLEDLFPLAASEARSQAFSPKRRTVVRDGDIATYARSRVAAEPDLGWAQWIAQALGPLAPEVSVPLESRSRVHRFRLGPARLLAFERNISYQMSEDLKQAGGNESLEKPVEMEARLASTAHVYDLRTQGYVGRTDRLRFTLDPWQPSLFALLPERVAGEDLIAFLERQGPQSR